MPSEGAPQTGCLTSLAQSTRRLNSVAITKWAARASADKVLAYWDVNASPSEWILHWEANAGPIRANLQIKARLIANAQALDQRAQWVRDYLAMSASPSHPHHRMGGTPGQMAPSPAIHQVSSPSTSMAQSSLPACLTKTAPHQNMQSLSPLSPQSTGQGGRSPTHTLLTVGESATLAARHAMDQSLQHLAYKFSLGFADTNPWVVDTLNAVALELQCWYQ
jgi:hypothetical protein